MGMNETLDLFWIIGMVLCVVFIGIYAKDIIKLNSRKKGYAEVTGTARTCKMQKNWAYTGVEVRYDYEVNGESYTNTALVKGTFNPGLKNGQNVTIYYDEKNPKESFLKDQISMSVKNILVLAAVILIFGITLLLEKK